MSRYSVHLLYSLGDLTSHPQEDKSGQSEANGELGFQGHTSLEKSNMGSGDNRSPLRNTVFSSVKEGQ